METGRFWPICPFGARNGQICFEFLLLCCRPRKGRFSMETGRFWPICPFGARNGEICFEFLLLCCKPRKRRFSMETGRFWPIALLGPEMITFASNFCYCCSFSMETGRFWPMPEMVKFASDFCYCAVDQEKSFFNGNGPFLAHLPFWGPKW